MHPAWFYIFSSHLKPTRPADPPYHLTRTLQPLDDAARPYLTRLDDLAAFATP
jgi:hypothetical protein